MVEEWILISKRQNYQYPEVFKWVTLLHHKETFLLSELSESMSVHFELP